MFLQFLQDAMGPERDSLRGVAANGERCAINSANKLMKAIATIALIIIIIQAAADGFSEPHSAGKMLVGFGVPTIALMGLSDTRFSKKAVVIAIHLIAVVLGALNMADVLSTQHMGYILLGLGLLYFAVKAAVYIQGQHISCRAVGQALSSGQFQDLLHHI